MRRYGLHPMTMTPPRKLPESIWRTSTNPTTATHSHGEKGNHGGGDFRVSRSLKSQEKNNRQSGARLPEKQLVLTLAEKSNYVIHYKGLQFYLRQGKRFKMVHQVIEFEQEPYIQMNTEFRKAAETNFYKLMNNAVLSKTMTNRIDVKIVCSRETDKICSLLYARREIFGNDLVGINMH